MVKTKSYTLRTEKGNWLAQILISSDGMFSAVSNYGNYAYAWRSFGEEDFRAFFLDADKHYIAGKLFIGLGYCRNAKQHEKNALEFSEKVFIPFQQQLKSEIDQGIGWD